jgi:tRNA modification GTPase
MTGSDESTIVAVATPPGEGGIGVVRLSGPACLAIAAKLFHASGPGLARGHRLRHGRLRDPETGGLLDDCLMVQMPGPHSYTGEDVVEFQCHGSPVLLQRVVACCLAQGAQPAQRGEFTLRAFLHGKLDLAQAEAVIDLVRARTPTAAQVAAQALTGALARKLAPATDSLTGVLAYLEASIDFVEEGLPHRQIASLTADLAGARDGLAAVLRRAAHGAILRDGVRVVLAGKPNVGKSSLLNALLRRDRAIVTAIAGTTRDTLEEPVAIHDLPMQLVDTAGLSESGGLLEQLGVQRSLQAIEGAAIILLVLDASVPATPEDARVLAAIRLAAPRTAVLLVANKSDLAPTPALPGPGYLAEANWSPAATVACSAVTGAGLADLEDALADLALGGEALNGEETVVENARQAQALREAVEAVTTALDNLRSGRPLEIICLDLRHALEALAGITGLNAGEAVLDRIFSEFCIGK